MPLRVRDLADLSEGRATLTPSRIESGRPAVSHGDAPLIRSTSGDRPGIAERGDAVVANRWIATLPGERLFQFRMGYGVHLELGEHHEVTIETPFSVIDGETQWSGEPLTAGAAGALLPLNLRDVTTSRIGPDGTLVLAFGPATLTVPPHPMDEAWQVRGPNGLLIVCSPGGDYVAVWAPESKT
jgi:Family of unknown function (DUF6188)